MDKSKKLCTFKVIDKFKSSEEVLLVIANETAADYASLYKWTDISVQKSSQKNPLAANDNNSVSHFFDVYGTGDEIDLGFDSELTAVDVVERDLAAKDAAL